MQDYEMDPQQERLPVPRVENAAMASAAATALGEIQAAMMIARQFPRDLPTVQRKCIDEAKLSGDLFYYGWDVTSEDQETGEVRKSRIEGPSIDLALCAIRNFGNAHVRQRPLLETPSSFIFTAAVIDYETGFVYERQFRQDKSWTIYGKMDKFRKDDVRFQIGQSKASRNAILNFLPAGLIDRMMEAAKSSVREQIDSRIKKESIAKVRADILAALIKVGATQPMVEEKLGLEVEDWDAETLTMLTGDLRAIKRGTESVQSLYAASEPESEPPAKPSGKGTLDINAMKAGDPTTHQGHPEALKKAESGPIPTPDPTTLPLTSHRKTATQVVTEEEQGIEAEVAPSEDATLEVFVTAREKLEKDLSEAYEMGHIGTKNHKAIEAALSKARTMADIDNCRKVFESGKKGMRT